MKITQVFEITGKGVGLLLDCERFDSPGSPFSIEVVPEGGLPRIFMASKEYARKLPPGEVEALFVSGVQSGAIPVGASVRVIWGENT